MLDLQSFKGFTPGPWSVGWPDGSGSGEWDGTYSIIANGSSSVVRSGDSFGSIYGVDIKSNAALIAAAPDLLALAIKQEAEIKRLKAALAVAKDFLTERADHADDTGSNAEMKCLSEITGIMEGYYPHA